MWVISMVALGTVIAVCLLGIYHRGFKDNVLQCLGMGAVIIGALGRISELWVSGVSDGLVVVYAGVAVYCVGTMSKVIWHYGREVGWRAVRKIDNWLFERQTAAAAFDSKPHHHT